MLPRNRKPRSAGYTLIELLVVIAIIAVLTSLFMGAVQMVRVTAPRLETSNAIFQINGGFDTAFKDFPGVKHVPSRLALHEDGMYNTAIPLQAESVDWLMQMFPRTRGPGGPVGTYSPHVVPINWNGDNAITPGNPGHFTLEGHQCLVFFLGGINDPNKVVNGIAIPNGFSKNPRNPADPNGDRWGPYVQFKASRFVDPGPNGATAPDPFSFKAYNDPHGNVYAYFSSYGRTNGPNSPINFSYNRYGSSDCASLGVSPYEVSANRFYHPNSFQIISAGRDKRFGPGGRWEQNMNNDTRDDQANFSPATLGAGPR